MKRWEITEKLPVRRHLHEKQRTVYAFKSEIDTRSQGRQFVVDGEGFDDCEYSVEIEEQSPSDLDLPPDPDGLPWLGRGLLTPKLKLSLAILGVAAADRHPLL